MSIDIQIPQIGESITTVFIARWLKAPGEAVRAGEAVVEVDSDKATMEVPAPVDGVLKEQLAEEGDEISVGAPVARLEEGSVPAAETTSSPSGVKSTQAGESAPSSDGGEVRAGPAARKSAREGGVDLHGVEGSGPRGRVTRQDVEKAVKTEPPVTPVSAPVVPQDAVRRVAMSPLRRTIARRLVEVQHNAAILTTFNEIDMQAVMSLRSQFKERFEKRYGVRLGFMSFFVKACVSALMEFPAVNAEIDGNDVLYKNYYNIGVAVSGPRGLVVPVLRNADQLSFAGVEQGIGELAGRARDNKLTLADFQDGTFTISNGGVFGSLMSTPILNPPQVGILGMHTIQKRPVVVGDQIEIRPMMYVALSYDHRIIDGREAVSFLKRVKELVEDPQRILIEV